MKQVLLDLKSGKISVEEVPVPAIIKGVIVQNCYSLISAGTESSLIHLAEESLIGKAKARPDLLNIVLKKVKTDGILSAYEQAMSRLNKSEPLGYSCSGVVVESNVEDFKMGDRVACAGAGFANHAEYNYIPKNLCVKVPDSVDLRHASFMTVGAIAMQGIRNAKISIGERVVVIGLGLVGLITVQLLKAAGCRVFGIDTDKQKLLIAAALGADIVSTSDNAIETMKTFSEFGSDAVIITAATKSDAPIVQAGELVRDKGRIVVVGDVGLGVPRNTYYTKEAELVISRSYGPGRYDRSYEEKGIDYPIIVRWTEKRNMQAFIELIEQKKVTLEKLITHEFSIEQSQEAYNVIKTGKDLYIGVILKYNIDSAAIPKKNVVYLPHSREKSKTNGKISLGLIGAGIQATSAILPNLTKLPVTLKGVATSTGISAQSVAKKFGFEYCTTNVHEILDDPAIDAVIIATRNDSHARITIDALNAGKDVLVEKPLATNYEDLQKIIETWKKSECKVMVGFNRRYSPYAKKIKEFYKDLSSPLIMNYRINAGQISAKHWVHDDDQGSGMLISEVCHFVDTLQFICGSKPSEVYARSPWIAGKDRDFDNLQVLLSFENGSIGTITYTTQGDSAYSKEQMEIFGGQTVAVLKDYRELSLIRNGKTISSRSLLKQNKGVSEELKAFIQGDVPDFTESIVTTLAILKIKESLKQDRSMKISENMIFDHGY